MKVLLFQKEFKFIVTMPVIDISSQKNLSFN